jgi:opine dehydrogenase
MKVTVLGSGNGGCAVAADWSLAGNEVSLFDFVKFPTQIEEINKKGGITVSGELEGFAPIHYAGHNIEKAIEGAELIIVVGPAYSTEPFAKAVKPFIKKGQNVIVSPGSCGGALLFKKTLGLDFEDESIVVAETSTLPYACRIIKAGQVYIYLKLKGGLYISALPSIKTKEINDIFSEVYAGAEMADNFFQVVLQNANPVIHPAVTLLNAGRIESTKGDFYFYEDGVTPGVGRLMKAVDEERISIGKALGVSIIPDPELGIMQGYMKSNDYETGYSSAPGFKGIKAQSQLDHRYLNEDVGYGLVFMTELAEKLKIQTPVMDAVIKVASAVMVREYAKESERSLLSLGLSDYSAEELKNLF